MPEKPEEAKITLPPHTAPAELSFAMRAFARTEDANRVAHKLASYIRLISSAIILASSAFATFSDGLRTY